MNPLAWSITNPMTRKRVLLAMGLLLIALGIAFNPSVVRRLFYGPTEYFHWTRRYVLVVLEVAWVSAGLFLFAYAKKTTGSLAEDLRTAIRRHPRKTSAAMGISFTAILYASVEIGFFIYNKTIPQLNVVTTGNQSQNIQSDDLLGFGFKENARVTYRKVENERVVFDVAYTIDDAGRRVVPAGQADRPGPPVLFFGCSFTFGVGVNDDDTMPNQFALAAPQHPVVNCAIGGYGPQQMLALLDADRLDPLIREKSPIVVYTFIDDHVRRVIGSMRCVTNWGGQMPYYRLDDHGQPARIGQFVRDRPLKSVVYALAAQSQMLKTLKVDLPPRLNEADYRLTARILEEAQRRLDAKTKDSRFYLLFYPGCQLVEEMTAQFKDPNVNVLDYSNLFPWPDPEYKLQGDLHPTPRAHQRLAQQLAKDLFPQ
jgi:hypothetical protein